MAEKTKQLNIADMLSGFTKRPKVETNDVVGETAVTPPTDFPVHVDPFNINVGGNAENTASSDTDDPTKSAIVVPVNLPEKQYQPLSSEIVSLKLKNKTLQF